MFEAPSAQQVEDFKYRFLNSGMNEQGFEDVCRVAESYDKLRNL